VIDPTDPLLDLGDAAVPIVGDPVRLAFVLAAGGGLELPIEPSRLALLRRARRDGEQGLWLALGALAYGTRVAPIVVWPVELADDGRLVHARGRAPRINDVLVAALAADGIDLPLAGDGELDLATVLARASAVADARGWHVERVARVAVLSFAAFDVARDTATLGLANPLLNKLCGDAPADELPRPALDDVVAPLDADARQLAAISAAAAGASFVVTGGPGTGKSQTIANLVAHCTSAGKSVLVVSDRAPALDVVLRRLAAAGIGEFCLPLYGEHAAPAQAITALTRVLDRAFRPAPGSAGSERARALATALDTHRNAIHATTPLGITVHDVIARLVELRTVPRAALAERDAALLDRTGFDRRLTAVRALADAARHVEPIAGHAWRAAAPSQVDRTAPPCAPGAPTGFGGADGQALVPAVGEPGRVVRVLGELRAALGSLAASLARFALLVPGCVARTPVQLRALGALAARAALSPRPGAELLTVARSSRADDVGERVALIRARGGGAIEPPRDPATFIAIAQRRRALADEVAERFVDADALPAEELWAQLKRWTTSAAPLRFVALRGARGAVRAAAQPGAVESDAVMLSALEATIAERACRAALLAADAPARRWFGELGGDPLSLDLDAVERAATWGADLRRAFDRVTIAGGDTGRQTAWRALVAQVAAGPEQARVDRSGSAGPRSTAEGRCGDSINRSGSAGPRSTAEGRCGDSIDRSGSAGPRSTAEGRCGDLIEPFAELAAAVASWDRSLAELADATGIAMAALADGADHLQSLGVRLNELTHAAAAFPAWARFHSARHAARVAGVEPAIEAIERGDLPADQLADAWQRATLLAWLEAEMRATPALARFDGSSHHTRVAAFTEADRAAHAAARACAIARLSERVPSQRLAGHPESALLRAARADRPLRELLAGLPTLLPRLAPCVLATPQAVARELAVTGPRFDVVVFDEASQLPLGHALGALARAHAAVVVGDPQQGSGAGDVLAAALAAGWPKIELETHYRSRHDDVFAFANRAYYADRVDLLPAAAGAPDLGIAWRCVTGVADASGANRTEADAVVRDVVAALRARPERTIAVVVASRAQEELIRDLLHEACSAQPALVAALAAHAERGEPLLIATPDRLHGEERDVTVLSVGGSADELGAFAQAGASRWLAVATTRAREQLVVVTSFAPEAIPADAPACARELAALIERARDATNMRAESGEAMTPITAAIARALSDRGWIVRHRVGTGPLPVELAVVDPDRPDRFVLAIEHDGPTYARLASARDRDRLRAQRLAQLGWRVHRVWSLDWWRDPERETQRAHSAIVAALAASRQRVASAPVARPRVARGSTPLPVVVPSLAAATALAAGSGPTEALVGASTTPTRVARGSIAIGPYIAAAIPAGRRAPDDMFAPKHHAELGKVVEQVLAAEAPICLDLLARRVGAYFGVGKVTPRVTDQVRVALAGRGRWGDEEGVVWRLDQDPAAVPAVRIAGAHAAARRDVGEVPLSELAAAVRVVVERTHDIGPTDLVRDCARLLGFPRITERVAERVAAGVRLASARELIAVANDRATLP
jgi:hypothetical protein